MNKKHTKIQVQQFVPSPQNNEGMLLSKPSFATRMKGLGEIWTTHMILDSLSTSSKG